MDPPSHKGLFTFLQEKYDRPCMLAARKYVNISKRLARHVQHLTFNTRCKRYSVIPTYLRARPLVPSAEGRKIALRFSTQSLLAQICLNHRAISRLQRDLDSQYVLLSGLLSSEDLTSLVSLRNQAYDVVTQRCKSRQKSKFDKLLSKSFSKSSDDTSSDRWVVNLSSATLAEPEVAVLRKGLNFAPSPSRVPVTQFIASVERCLSAFSQEEAAVIRKKVAVVLQKSKPPPSNLPPPLHSALRNLGKRDDILILPADKGRATVVLDKIVYDAKVLSLLNDDNTYKKLDKDPTQCMERKLNTLLLQLKKKGAIPNELYNRLRSSGGLIPLLYGLPKLHKADVPLRPIVSFFSSPTYHLSKYLSKLLAPLIEFRFSCPQLSSLRFFYIYQGCTSR